MANPVLEHIFRDGKTYDIKDMYAERAENKTSEIRSNPDHTHFPTERAVSEALALKEDKENKIVAWKDTLDPKEYPNAQLVKDSLDQLDDKKVDKESIATDFGETPSDQKVASEKLLKDTIDQNKTIVVDGIPAVEDAVEGVNYVVKCGDGGLLYKLIDGEMRLVGGSKVYVSDTKPEPADSDEFTDYYIKNQLGVYVHYRFINGTLVEIGADAYTKEESKLHFEQKEDKINKVTAFQEEPTDLAYPSEKLVKTSLDNLKSALEGKIDAMDVITSVVVTALPKVSEAKAGYDYFLKQGNGVLLYKVVDGSWKMVGGAMTSVSEELPESGDPFTDYYIATDDPKIYLHYRFAAPADGEDGFFYAVGADSYSKQFIDEALSGIRTTHQADKENIDSQIQQANRNIQTNKDQLESLTGQQKTYSANLEQVGENYVFQLLEAIGEGDGEVVSSFQLPATGGGGGGSSATTLVVERVTETPVIVTPTDKAIIQVNFSSVDADGESVDASYTMKMGSTAIMSGAMAQGINTFDVTEYCSVGSQKFTLTVTDDGGSTNVKSWTVQMVDVRIETAFSDRYTNDVGRSVNFSYTPYGSVSKTIHFKLDGVELEPVITTASGILQSYTLAPQSHGAHLLECWITATVNNKSIETEHIYRDIIWFDSASDDPVIGCIYRADHYGFLKVRQYNAVNIPWVVYDPRTNTPAVTLQIDGELVSEQHVTNAANTWSFKPDTVTMHILTITCRTTTVTLKVEVTELGYNIQPVTANLEFDFNPTGITNSSANRLWADKNNPDVKMTVSENFDWNNGGYQVDSEGNQYFCVKSGTRAFISHNLFGADPKRNGAEFKLIFKTTNVRDKDALFLSCMTGSSTDKAGLEMRTHCAYLHTSSDMLEHSYSEEDVIEFEYNVNSIDEEDAEATSFIMTYEDGVGGRPLIYPNDDGYRIYQFNPVPITIGSDDCDVHIYRMKAYSSALTDSDILSNFIADARDSDTMISRYERNLIYNENNELTPESVAAACPDLKVIKISCPHFTNDKKDYVKYTNVECIHKNGDPALDNWTFTNGYHAGQGTTSNRYGLAGRNIDIIFGFDGKRAVLPEKYAPFDSEYVTTLTLGDGTRYTDGSGKIALKRSSVPNNWFNIKVNIASSENANNALLQKRYNEFLPYKTPAMCRDSRVKNSMEFVNCVIFVRETDPDISTHREFPDTNWHFYAIGNIGDSKKTDNTRVNDPEDMKEFVVEITDNTMPNSTFDTGVYLDANGKTTFDPTQRVKTVYPITKSQWTDERNTKRKALYEDWDGSFEFRYDMGTKDGEAISGDVSAAQQEESKQVFRNMYEFVVTSSDDEFVNQFGNWFIEESPLYWYLFTERYTMIDNRAKNSFWHWGKTYISQAEADEMGDEAQYYTIDDTAAAINNGYRFDLWDYDNDTALGIDNNGELNMTYGHEDTDYKTDGDPSSGYIFNAADSVFWCRIRNLMNDKLQTLYRSRESLNCWSASSLIEEFDSWQEQFPEELWRIDIERKYLRPYYTGNPVAGINPSKDFLQNMMNGRKRYQRRQFERDQEIYIGTKYFGTNQCADTKAISFRCNTPQVAAVAPDYTLRIVPYSDMYLWVKYGNSNAQGVRAKAGKEYVFKTALTTMDDTMILIMCAENIQALNDLSACYIRANDFSAAKRLKTLTIGSDAMGYSNPFITTLSIKDNTLLETLDIRNCPNLTGSLNFSGCPNLVTLLAEGTAVGGVTFAKNGKIQTAHLPATIGSLTLNNLNYLTDLVVDSYENLVTFVCEYCSIDPYDILIAAIDTLQIVRILGIDWSFYKTDILNKVYAMSSSLLSGKVEVTGPIRLSEISNYTTKWTDLELVYDSEKIVPQYTVLFCNDDGTLLGRALVDQGSTPPDPFETGILTEVPKKEPDQQYTYTFAGFDDMDSAVFADKRVYATYTGEIRTYTVSWYAHKGDAPLLTKNVEYGNEAVYDGAIPKNDSEEFAYIYNLFAGWDKSTGYITGDIDVYAIWARAEIPSAGTDLSDMTPAEINAVTKSGRTEEFFELKDHVDIVLGHDFDFSNVESVVLCENQVLDGETAIDTDICLFGEDSPSFTLAIDFRFTDTTVKNTLLSCFEEDGSEGFRFMYDGYPNIQWGDQNNKFGYGKHRDIVVLRHIKGDNNLYIYASNGTSSKDVFDADITAIKTTRSRSTSTNATITIGAVKYPEGWYDFFGYGYIYWCKLWLDDLGEENAKALASWYHETVRMEFAGPERYRLYGQSGKCAASFIANNLLTDRGYWMNASETNSGGWNDSLMRAFLNSRVYNALPTVWKSLVKTVRVPTSAGNSSSEIIYSTDNVYLESYTALSNNQSRPYKDESSYIPWFTSNQMMAKFNGFIVPDDATYYTSSEEPSTIASNNIKAGDRWQPNGGKNLNYILITKEDFKISTFGSGKNTKDGKYVWVLARNWCLRSPATIGIYYWWFIGDRGYCATGNYDDYSGKPKGSGICLCFSV